MRIALISYDFGEYCVQHANGLLSNGEVLLVLPTELLDPFQDLLCDEVDVYTFVKPRLRDPIRQLLTIYRIIKRVEKFRPDVIHFQLGHMWFNFALPYLRRRYPIVFTIHDPRQHLGDRGSNRTPQWVMDFGYRRSDQIIVHGAQPKEVLITELAIAPDKITVIPHIAIGERDFQRIDSDENLILFFGRIWPYKGLEYLIRAQPHITREVENARILICGRGEEMDHYYQLMDDPSRFTVNNRWITDNERVEFFERASIVVLPYAEASQSGVVPVAYAHSKPVVATRTGGLPEIVDDRRTGLLVEPRNEVELAEAIVLLLKNKTLRDSMGMAGNQKLKCEMAPNVVCKKTAQVYQAAIESWAAAKQAS